MYKKPERPWKPSVEVSAETPSEVEARAESARLELLARCRANMADVKNEYRALDTSLRYWEASSLVRQCANHLDDADLKAMLKDAEIKAYTQDIQNPKATARTRANGIAAFLRDYPTEAKKYEPQIPKLEALAVNQEAAVARQEKAAEAARRKKEGVHIGMSADEVIASSWGKPQKVNRSTYSWGVREQWVYDGGYLYFRDGVLDSIQN
ncbi:MAG: hypothetical protein H0T52_11510 [Lautropia sp.]|nr:hypothetical protein [Lautropia sp.]